MHIWGLKSVGVQRLTLSRRFSCPVPILMVQTEHQGSWKNFGKFFTNCQFDAQIIPNCLCQGSQTPLSPLQKPVQTLLPSRPHPTVREMRSLKEIVEKIQKKEAAIVRGLHPCGTCGTCGAPCGAR